MQKRGYLKYIYILFELAFMEIRFSSWTDRVVGDEREIKMMEKEKRNYNGHFMCPILFQTGFNQQNTYSATIPKDITWTFNKNWR